MRIHAVGHPDDVSFLAVVGNRRNAKKAQVVPGSRDYTLRIWDVEAQSCLGTMTEHTSSVKCLTVVNGAGNGTGARLVS